MEKDKYKSYDRIHRYANPSDIEKGKIRRETSRSLKSQRKSEMLDRNLINHFRDSDQIMDLYDEYRLSSEKERKNARGHKRRLKELSRRKDFY